MKVYWVKRVACSFLVHSSWATRVRCFGGELWPWWRVIVAFGAQFSTVVVLQLYRYSFPMIRMEQYTLTVAVVLRGGFLPRQSVWTAERSLFWSSSYLLCILCMFSFCSVFMGWPAPPLLSYRFWRCLFISDLSKSYRFLGSHIHFWNKNESKVDPNLNK